MPTVEASFTDPDSVRHETHDGTWFLTGTSFSDDSSIDKLLSTGDGAVFCQANRDALVVFVEHAKGLATTFRAWRAILSGRELFVAIRPDRGLIVSDHFVNVLAAMPPQDRLPNEKILVSHYLFRETYGPLSYSSNVTRLSHAEHLRIELSTGRVESSQFDRIEDETLSRPTQDYVDVIDATLKRSLSSTRVHEPAAMMFSGGVDSALLMTYIDPSVPPVTFVPDTPEFAEETTYARQAASLLGVETIEMPLAEARFVPLLEAATDLLGTPVFDDTLSHLGSLIHEQQYKSFYSGEGADSAFGMSLKLARFASWFRFPGVRHTLHATAPRTPGILGYRMRQVEPIATQLAKDLMDPEGFAANARAFGDTSLFQSLVSPSLVREAKIEQLEYVDKRIVLTASNKSAFLAHIESAHWATILGNPAMPERLIAHASGKRFLVPFLDSEVLIELARIPIEDRYVRGLRAKWILKDLLAERLSGYPTNQRKKATALPFERFYTSGPLSNFWDRYDVPDIFEGTARDALVRTSSTSTWNAITYAVWEKRVAKNENLEPFAATVEGSFAIR